MIRRIYADLPKFRTLNFNHGLNILLAEKGPGATDKQTRNRAGKSSVLEIMHFLLGGTCRRDSVFRSAALNETTFGMEFDLGGTFARVERCGAQASQVSVAGDTTRWPISPTRKDDHLFIKNDDWKAVLAKLMFGLDELDEGWSPTFRSLISYFIRRDRDGGMHNPMMHFTQQRLVDQQVNVSFLLGLDWSVAREWQNVRDREKSLEQLRKGMAEGAFGTIIGTAAALRSELIVAQDRARRLRGTVTSFRVVQEYHELEREASKLTARLAELADENVLDRRYLSELEKTTIEEVPPAPEDLESLYHEANVVLPDAVRKRFEDVAAFHKSVVKNRRGYLQSEIEAAKRRVADRDAEKVKIDERRAEVMGVLQSAGALDQFVALQGELTKAEASAQALAQRHDSAEALETGSLRLTVERARLVERLRLDLAEQSTIIERAVLTFSEIAAQLYEDEQPGSLAIVPTDNGPDYQAHMPGEKSKGINNMRIFCFDMMLTLLSVQRGHGPGFLVHDSHLFDGVDERQIGKALAVGATLAKKWNFQYIVTMNTDAVPREVPAWFRLEDYAIEQRLTDVSEDGGLFGFRFE
jgi:uncharacterized protein YydD (DUF2326 family)